MVRGAASIHVDDAKEYARVLKQIDILCIGVSDRITQMLSQVQDTLHFPRVLMASNKPYCGMRVTLLMSRVHHHMGMLRDCHFFLG